MAATTALVPIQSFVPSGMQTDRFQRGLSRYTYPQPYRPENKVVFSVMTPAEVEGLYGPDGKKAAPSRGSEFVDIYV